MRVRDQPSIGLAWSRWMAVLCGFVSSCLMALSFAPLYVWPCAFVAIVPLLAAARRVPSGWRTFFAVILGHAPVLGWQYGWVMPVTGLGFPFLVFYIALYPAVFVCVMQRLRDRVRLPWAMLVPVVWVGLECIRGKIIFDGYPWMLLGHPLIEQPQLVQSADIFGVFGIGALVAATNGAISDAMVSRTRRPIWRRQALTTVVVLWIASTAYGFWRLSSLTFEPGPSILVLQTHLPQDNKMGWSVADQQTDVVRWLEMTEQAVDATSSPIDLIVWPETMLPGVGFEEAALSNVDRFGAQWAHLVRWPRVLQAKSSEWGIPVLVGSITWDESRIVLQDDGSSILDKGTRYNSAILVDGARPHQRWDKHVLTPFGETMPYVSVWPWLEKQLMSLGAGGMTFDLASGSQGSPLLLARDGASGLALATPICFEDLHGELLRSLTWDGGERRAQVLVNLSNDGWFGSSDVSRIHHCQLGRMHCIETRTPMVRAVNTGCSVHLDAKGNVAGVIGEGRYGTSHTEACALFEPQLHTGGAPVYAYVGDLVAWLGLVGFVLLLGAGLVFHPMHERRSSVPRMHGDSR